MISMQLPNYHDVGEARKWFLPLPPAAGDPGETEYYVTVARFIGFSSSHTDNHWGHREEYVPSGSRCNACRWFELRIFRELDVDPDDFTTESDPVEYELGDYVVYKAGMSVVPGEVPLCRYDTISSPHEVIEALTTRQVRDDGPRVFITKPSALALASAAQHDAELESAYVNRAIG